MPKKEGCAPRNHNWAPLRRGSSRERCTICGTTFPCAHECGHVDCILATGRQLPSWIWLTKEEG